MSTVSSMSSWNAALWGGAMGALRVSVEYPFVVIHTNNIPTPHKSSLRVALNIFQAEGPKGFYRGATTKYTEKILMGGMEWFIMAIAQKYWSRVIPNEDKKSLEVAKALSVAGCEVALLPLDRLRTKIVNEIGISKVKDVGGYRKLLENSIKADGWSSLYNGWKIALIKSNVLWLNFLLSRQYFLGLLTTLDPQKKHPVITQSALVALAAWNMSSIAVPLEAIKTKIQMRKEYQTLSMHQVVAKIYKECGIKGFIPGFGAYYMRSLPKVAIGLYMMSKITANSEA